VRTDSLSNYNNSHRFPRQARAPASVRELRLQFWWTIYTLTEWQKRVFRPIPKEPFRHELVWLVPIPRYELHQNQSLSYEAIQRTIVVQAGDVNIYLHP
jgi:hypothetical protein